MHDGIPSGPDTLTPAWLTASLRSAGVLSQASVTALDTTIIGQEWGFTGIVARVSLEYDVVEPGAPATLVAKFPNAAGDTISTYREAQQRDPVAARRYFERCAREIWFYQRIAPQGSVAAPRMYFGAADLDAGRFVLLLEDLHGLRSGDAQYGCSARDAEAVLQAIAPFHARWWNAAGSDDLAWVPEWIGDPDARHQRYNQRVEPFLERFGARIPDAVRDLTLRLRPVYRDGRRR